MRNLLVIAKVVTDVEPAIDACIAQAATPSDLIALIDAGRAGRGLLHWAAWYDTWSMGNDCSPTAWRYALGHRTISDSLWELDLNAPGWAVIEAANKSPTQWLEQHWLRWHLWHAHQSFAPWNSRARLFYGRTVFGASLADEEIIGEAPR